MPALVTTAQARPQMSELRKDPVVERWVILSPERAARPSDFIPAPIPTADVASCAFCPGHESQTPPEVLAGRRSTSSANAPDWTYRIVPNKFPALRAEGELLRVDTGLYDRITGIGAHEVVVETPDHTGSLATMSDGAVADVLEACRERMRDLKKDQRFEHILFWKNHGAAAGATLEHPHSQLLALPIIPGMVREELAGAVRHVARTDRCIWCDIIEHDRQSDRLIAAATDAFTVLAPFAPRCPFETWVLPSRHCSAFEETTPEDMQVLATTLRDLLRRINRVLGTPPYNLMLHTAPLREPQRSRYHWHVELIPKLTTVAGFEWGSGFFINPIGPEESAARLRNGGE